ncbi:hypothetical protein TCON_2728, partial [Astathelohania contejeani]
MEIILNSKIEEITSLFINEELKTYFENKYSSFINFNVCVREIIWELCSTDIIPSSVKSSIEDCLFKLAIEENYFMVKDIKYMRDIKFSKIEEDDIKLSEIEEDDKFIRVADFAKFLWFEMRVKEHFRMVSHRRFICQEIYKRMVQELNYFNIPPDMIDRHDLSKLSLVTSLAYTIQNIDKVCHTPSRQFKEKHINDSKIYPLTIDGIKQQMSTS